MAEAAYLNRTAREEPTFPRVGAAP
jgi:hypothetical protein